jgi:lipoprotein signal peptidase
VLSHERSLVVYGGGLVVDAALLLLTPHIGSRAVSVGSGLAAGGAFATVACGLAWPGGVPNPLTHGDVAFNLADLAIAIGVPLLIGGSLLQGWLERDRLFEAVDAPRDSE